MNRITQRPNRLKSEITLAKDAYQLAFEADPSVGTRAQWLASFAVSGSSYDLGDMEGTVTLDRTDGEIQHGFISGNTTFAALTSTFAGARLILVIDYTIGTPSVDFTGIDMNPYAATLLPVSLAAEKAYQFEFSFVGGGWVISAVSGPFTQTLYP